MLNELSDFYRIVNPEPPDALIIQRRDGITAFIEQLDHEAVRFACAEFALVGLIAKQSQAQLNFTKLLAATLREHQPALSNDVAKIIVDLRVCAVIALAEYLASENAETDVAALVLAAAASRGLPSEIHMANLVGKLISVAKNLMIRVAEQERAKNEFPTIVAKGGDIPSLVANLNVSLEQVSLYLLENRKSEREELDILWWVFGERSSTTDEPFALMEMAPRTVMAAIELANLSVLPPLAGSLQFIRKVIGSDSEMSLESLINGCSKEVLEASAVHTAHMQEIVKNHAPALPFTWLCMRRLESDLADGWQPEFGKKTGLNATTVRPAIGWAEVIFSERVAARLIAATNSE